MAHYNTILSQITSHISRHDFDYHAKIHHSKIPVLQPVESVYGNVDWATFRQKKPARYHR